MLILKREELLRDFYNLEILRNQAVTKRYIFR